MKLLFREGKTDLAEEKAVEWEWEKEREVEVKFRQK